MGAKSFGLTLGPKAHEEAFHMHGMNVAGHPLINEGHFCIFLTLGSYI